MNIKKTFLNIINRIRYEPINNELLNIIEYKKYGIYAKIIEEELLTQDDCEEALILFGKLENIVKEYTVILKSTFIDGKSFEERYEKMDMKLLNQMNLIFDNLIHLSTTYHIDSDWTDLRINDYKEISIKDISLNISKEYSDLGDGMKEILTERVLNSYINHILNTFDNYILFMEYNTIYSAYVDTTKVTIDMNVYYESLKEAIDWNNENINRKNKLIELANKELLPTKIYKIYNYLHSLYDTEQNADKYEIDEETQISIFTEYNSGMVVKDDNHYDKKNNQYVKLFGIDESLVNENKDLIFIYKGKYKIIEKVSDGVYPDNVYYSNSYFSVSNEKNEIIFEFNIDNEELDDVISNQSKSIKSGQVTLFKNYDWIKEITDIYKIIINKQESDSTKYRKDRYKKEYNQVVDNFTDDVKTK